MDAAYFGCDEENIRYDRDCILFRASLETSLLCEKNSLGNWDVGLLYDGIGPLPDRIFCLHENITEKDLSEFLKEESLKNIVSKVEKMLIFFEYID